MSSVVATLIILVISVLLATVASYYAINVTSCRSQKESLNISNQQVWFDYTSQTSQAALLVTNTDGRDAAIERLTVREQNVNWNSVYY